MLIKKIEIISFGKFCNKTIEFEKGLNIIRGNNESGKSTIISFIYAMLYGFGDNRGKGLSLREKYTPWNGGGVCEGKLYIETDNGDTLVIYRKAGSAKKYDILKIYNFETGAMSEFPDGELMEIGSDTFLKTLCVRQLSTITEGSNDEIAHKLSNIAKGGDERISYEKAIKILDNVRREILPMRGSGGLLAKVKEEISREEKTQSEYQRNMTELSEISKILPKIKNEKIRLEKEYAEEEKNDCDLRIARLHGRLEERRSSIEKPQKASYNKVFLPLCAIFLIISLSLLILKMWLALPFLIASLTIFYMAKLPYFKKETISEDDNITTQIQNLEKEKADHETKLRELKIPLSEATEKLLQLERRADTLKAITSDTDAKVLPRLKKEKQLLEKKLSAITLTQKALEKAYENMQTNFTPHLSKKASYYFSNICDGKYTEVFSGEDFSMKINDSYPKESSFFSGGTVDQLYLSLRLALIDMIFGEKTIFLLLDQPFLQYDSPRKENTLRLFQSLEKSRQILLFTSDNETFSENKAIELLT